MQINKKLHKNRSNITGGFFAAVRRIRLDEALVSSAKGARNAAKHGFYSRMVSSGAKAILSGGKTASNCFSVVISP